jgi:hypothetical protein
MSSSGNDKTIRISISGLLSTLLTVAFIVLKLCKVIDWSWWWVLAPLWIPIVLALVIVGVCYWIAR